MATDKILRCSKQLVKSLYKSVGEFIWKRLEEINDDKICMIEAVTANSITIGAVKQTATDIAVALLDRGVNKSSLIAFYGPNSIQHAVLRVAVQLLGVTFMPLSPTFGQYEVTEEIKAVGADIVMCSAKDLYKFSALLNSNNNNTDIKLVVVFDGKHGKHVTYDRLCEEGKGLGGHLAKVPYFDVRSSDETLFLIHTSGTTGAPKCAMVPHRMILNDIPINNTSVSSIVFSFLSPLGHISGTLILPTILCSGGTIVMFPDYNAEFIAQSVEKYRINWLNIYPTVCKQMVDHGLLERYDMFSLRMLSSGGAAFSADIARAFIKKYGLMFKQAYGMTEYSPVSSNISSTDYEPGNCGHITPGTELKVVDLITGMSLGPQTDGEICIRGANIIRGYRNNAKAWAEVVDKEGWYRTGDIGHYDDRECIFITDRIKEVMRIGMGQHYINISPVEIEQYLLTHPSIAEVAVVGVNNTAGTHRPRAYVVLKPGHNISGVEIKKFVSDTLAYTKQLTGDVVFVDHIVRTSILKVDRKYYRNLVKGKILD